MGKRKDQDNNGGSKGEHFPFSDISPQYRGKFEDVFDTVLFAILGGSTVKTFRDIFESTEGDEETDVEGKDGPVGDPPASCVICFHSLWFIFIEHLCSDLPVFFTCTPSLSFITD